MKKSILRQFARSKKRTWAKGETPHCEIRSIGFGLVKKNGSLPPLIIELTPRGLKEWKRQERNERRQQRRFEIDVKRHPEKYGVDVSWLLFGPFRFDGQPVLS